MTTPAAQQTPALEAQQSAPPLDRQHPAASAELVQKKRNAKVGALQDEIHVLEAALEFAYDELERRDVRIAILEAQKAGAAK